MNKVENKIQETLKSIVESKIALKEASIYSLMGLSIQGINLYIQSKIEGEEENIFEREEIKNPMETYLRILIKSDLIDLVYKKEDLPYEEFILDIILKNENYDNLKLGEIRQMISHYKMDFFKFVNDFIEIETGR